MSKNTKVNAAILIIGNEILSGRTQDTNTSTLATWLNSIGVKVRQGKPIRIDGSQDIADGPSHATAMGLLLWPLYATDHVQLQHPQNRSFKGVIDKIRHTIEDMF